MNRRQFWLSNGFWPEETREWVFFARAVQRIGRMLHHKDWHDDDPSRGLDPDEWLNANAVAQAKRLESFNRANTSFNWIASRCQTGELESGIRPVQGGEIVPLLASSWATEWYRLKDRLVFCQMRIDDPFAYGVGGFGPQNEQGMGYIFIGRERLDRLTWRTDGFDEYAVIFSAKRLAEPKRRGGRPKNKTGYDMPALQQFLLEVLKEDGVPDPTVDPSFTKADLERRAKEWCLQQWGKAPVHATLFRQIKIAIDNVVNQSGPTDRTD